MVGWTLTELLPVFLGAGSEAKADWSLLYVSMKFILIPFASIAIFGVVVMGVVAAVRARDSRYALSLSMAALIPAVYLLVLVVAPLWPLSSSG